MITYLDTSAAMKLLVEERASDALVRHLLSLDAAPSGGVALVASWLLHTELHCAAGCHPDDVDATSVGVVLDSITLIDLTRGDLMTAAGLPGRLRSHDAIHLAVALRVGVDEFITYDDELSRAAVAAGLVVAHPE